MTTERRPLKYTPIETTAEIGVPSIAAHTHGIELAPGRIFIVEAGVIETQAYRQLNKFEVGELTYVFTYLFQDIEDEYEHWQQTESNSPKY